MDDNEYDEAAAALERMRREKAERFQPLIYEHTDYLWDRSQEKFWDRVTHQLVGALVVDHSIPRIAWRVPDPPPGTNRQPRPVRPSIDIMDIESDLTVHTSTWHPKRPQLIEGVIADESGYTQMDGVKMFNTYRAPKIGKTDLTAQPWIDLVKRLFPNELEQEYFFNYCAHMIQKPDVKCNAGIVLSGCQGVGKDAILLPLKECVGFSNAKNIGPDILFDQFNDFVQATMLLVDEVRSQSDDHKATTMYNRVKELCAAPPNMLRVNIKFRNPIWVSNVCRLFMTTNEVDSMFLPKDDRRFFIMHTESMRIDVLEQLRAYWDWIRQDGAFALYHWLAARDISNFDEAMEPPKTAKHTEITESWGFAEDSPMRIILENLSDPVTHLGPEVLAASTLKKFAEGFMSANSTADEDIRALKRLLMPRAINRTMIQAGYIRMIDPVAKNGTWKRMRKINDHDVQIEPALYRRADVPIPEALKKAEAVIDMLLAEKARATFIKLAN